MPLLSACPVEAACCVLEHELVALQSVLVSTQGYVVPCGNGTLSSGHFRLSLFYFFLKGKLEYWYGCCVLVLKSLLLKFSLGQQSAISLGFLLSVLSSYVVCYRRGAVVRSTKRSSS